MVKSQRPKKQKEIDWLLSQNESQYLEFKQSTSDNLGKAICGFANSTGGKLIIGARPGGIIIGVHDPSDEAARVENIARTCKPPVNVEISYFEREGKCLLLLNIPRSESEIHQFGSGFYTRIGPMNQAMERRELEEFFWKTGMFRFEDRPRPEFKYAKDFNVEAFQLFLLRSKITSPKNKVDLLVNLGLAKVQKGMPILNNAGLLFFAREPTRFIRHSPVDCILFSGWDKVDILDRKILEGNLIENVDGAMAFLRMNLRLRYEIKTLKRKEILEIPEEALREALLNAIIHRDYLIEGANVTVEIYRDRVEISNPGGLAPGLKPEEFGKKTVRRNPLIADIFQRLGEIEKIGSGIQRMVFV
jgi:ATP-dependent DNA helicase RecG